MTESESERLLTAARALCNKMSLIHDDPLYKAVWDCAWNHGISYIDGPTYEHEFKALDKMTSYLTHRKPERSWNAP